MAEFDITGMTELLDKLQELPLSLGEKKRIIARSLRAAAEPIQVRASELAPFDALHDDGLHLKDNIIISVTDQNAEGATVKVGPAAKGKGGKFYYGAFNEWGSIHNTPKPFMRPAFDQKVEEVIGLISDSLREAIEEEATA